MARLTRDRTKYKDWEVTEATTATVPTSAPATWNDFQAVLGMDMRDAILEVKEELAGINIILRMFYDRMYGEDK